MEKPDKDKELCNKIDGYVSESRDARSERDKITDEVERFYRNKHWKRDQKRPFVNKVFQIVETEVPILTDSRPATDVIPIDPEWEERAQMLDAAKLAVYDKERLNFKDSQAIRSCLKRGLSWQLVDFDPDKENGLGDVTIKNLNFKQVFIDPTASDIDEARYVVAKLPMTKEDIKRLFPKFKGDLPSVNPKTIYESSGDTNIFDEDQDTKVSSPAGPIQKFKNAGNEMTVLDLSWMKDYSMEKIPGEETEEEIDQEREEILNGVNPDVFRHEDHMAHIEAHTMLFMELAGKFTGELAASEFLGEEIGPSQEIVDKVAEIDPESGLVLQIALDHIDMHKTLVEEFGEGGERPKYPNNLRYVAKVGTVILEDGAPDVDDDMIPLVPWYCYKDEDIWGIGAAENFIPIQKSLNEMYHKEHKGLKLCANPGWTADTNSGVDEGELTDEDGLVIMKKPGTEVSRLNPGQVSPQLERRMERDSQYIEDIEGINEATMGKAPSGDPSGKAIERLQQQAVGRIRQKSRNFEEYSIIRRDKLILSRIVRYYSTRRKLRIYDNNGKISFIDFDPKEVQQLEYEVRVSPGSIAGMDKGSIFAINKYLLEAGIITPKMFMEITDLPMKGKVLEHLEQQDEMKQLLAQKTQEALELKMQTDPSLITEEELAQAEQLGVDVGPIINLLQQGVPQAPTQGAV